MKVTKDNAWIVYDKALYAAKLATDNFLRTHGSADACGFAWVIIRPARGAFVNWMKAEGIGSSNYGGGYRVHNPSGSMTQSISAVEAGADEFARVLGDHGINCYSQSRMD